MPCFHPLVAKYEGGKIKIVKKTGIEWKPVSKEAGYFNLPCGKCWGCRLRYSRDWAIRMTHEAQLYEDNCFITLTFNPESLEARGHRGLDKTEFQKFMKRLRFEYDHKIRFYHCGEYGEQNGRPHYHAILFNHWFEDSEKLCKVGGNQYYTSEKLAKLWPYGFNVIGQVTWESCAYTARYVTKKMTGEGTDEKYTDPETGEVYDREYCTQSRMPGIGKDWYLKYGLTDVHNNDYVVPIGKPEIKVRPPRYYDKLCEQEYPELYEEIKAARAAAAPEPILEYNEELDRLWVIEESKEIKAARFARTAEKVNNSQG